MGSIDRMTDSRAALRRLALACAVSLLGLAGCSAIGPRSSPLPQEGPTLVEVYKEHMQTEGAGGSGVRSPRERLPLRAVDDDQMATSRRTALDPLQQRFERLPNPDLVMHVYPHLARGRYPVPGYVTVFPMYERVEYALPGEVAPRRSRNGEANRLPAGDTNKQAAQAKATLPCRPANSSREATQQAPC